MEKSERVVSLTTADRMSIDHRGTIQGWGADLDPKQRPGVPKDKSPYVGVETLYPAIEAQISDVKILKSNEHRQMPPVFGTTCPPAGLSGAIRTYAFKYSEGTFTHWLALMFADRVNVAEDCSETLQKATSPISTKKWGWQRNGNTIERPRFKKWPLSALGSPPSRPRSTFTNAGKTEER